MVHFTYRFRPIWVLCLLLSFSHLLWAWDISTVHPPGRLGIQLDFSLFRSWPANNNGAESGSKSAAEKRSIVFSTRLKFKQPTDVSHISDKQLNSLAIEAYKEMEALSAGDKYDFAGHQRPTIMTAMAYNDEIILSSSQKGRTSYSYGDPDHPESRPRANKVKQQLDMCQQMFMDRVPETDRGKTIHRNNGQCGEELVAHAFYRTHREDEADLGKLKGRVTTVQRGIKDLAHMGVAAIDPCNTPKEGVDTVHYWGCAQFVQLPEVNLQVVTKELEEDKRDESWMYDLSTLAGGLADGYPKSIDLCQ